MISNLVDCDPADPVVGLAVEARVEPIDDGGLVLPVFAPARGADAIATA